MCASCGYLVGVNDEKCYHCGRRNPGLWGFAPALRNLGHDMGFVPFVTGTCIVAVRLALLVSVMLGFQIASPSLFGLPRAGRASPSHIWRRRSHPCFRHGPLVDRAQRRLAPRRIAAHPASTCCGFVSWRPPWLRCTAPGRMVIIYTVASVVGFTAELGAGLVPVPFFGGESITVGASAAIFGLLGALVYYGKRGGSRWSGSQAWSMAVFMFVFGLHRAGAWTMPRTPAGLPGAISRPAARSAEARARQPHARRPWLCLGAFLLSIVCLGRCMSFW